MKKVFLPFLLILASLTQVFGQCASCGNPATYGQTGLVYVWLGGTNAAGASVALGSGEYNNACNWRISATTGSLATWETPCQPPQSHNDVHFLAASFPSASTITISSDASCRKMIWDDAIAPANKATLVSPNSTAGNPTKLDIYNELYLTDVTRLAFNHSGDLRFMSGAGGNVPITTNGQKLLLCAVRFAVAAGTTMQLQDAFYVDDIAQAANNSDNNIQGFIYLESGGFNTNGQLVRSDFFFTNNANTTRALNISNSTITLGGASTNTWMSDFTANASMVPTNHNSFVSTGSHIIIQGIAGINTGFTGGTRVQYDKVTLNTPLNTHTAAGNYLISGAPIINELYLLQDMFFHSVPVTVNTLYVQDGIRCRFNDGRGVTPKVILNSLVVLNDEPCKPVWMLADAARPFFMKRNASGGTTLTFNEVVLHEANADVTGGYTYIANNSWQVGIKTNWTINSNAACPCRRMRFHDRNNNQNWHTASNWDVWDGSAWQANTGEVPFICDDVEFDAMAFPNAGKFVKILAPAHCRNMEWTSGVNTNAELRQERLKGVLNIYGNFITHPDNMADFIYTYNNPATNLHTYSLAADGSNVPSNTSQIHIDFWGGFDVTTNTVNPATIQTGDATNCVHIYPYVRLRRGAYYNVANRYTGRSFQGLPGSTMYSNNIYMRLVSLHLDARYMTDTQVDIMASNTSVTSATEWSFYDYGSFSYNPAANPGQTHYTGNTTFHFKPNAGTYTYLGATNASKTYNGIAYAQPCQIPNAVFYGSATSNGELGGISYDLIVHGDLDLRSNTKLYAPNVTTTANRLLVTGSMGGTFTGSVLLTKGNEYVFSSGIANSRITVNGNFTSIGTCDEPIIVRTLNSNAIPVKISGISNIDKTSINGWNNTGNPVIVANNSVDAGNNTNVTINASIARTFYWRARQGSGGAGVNAYSGNWSDPRFWAVNVGDIEGGGSGCVPTLLDVVIFDAASGPTTDTCYIDGNSAAGTLWYQNNGLVSIACPRVNPTSPSHTPGFGLIQIGQNLWLDKNATNQLKHYTGTYQFVANGTAAGNNKQLRTSGTTLYVLRLEMADPTGTLTIQDALTVLTPSATIQTYTTAGGNYGYGVLMLSTGILDLNNQNIRIGNQFVSVGALTRTLRLTNSHIIVECNGTNYAGSSTGNSNPWFVNGTNITINTGTGSLIDFLNNTISNHYTKTFSMGTLGTIRYNDVVFWHTDEGIRLNSRTTYRNIEFKGEAYIDDNNTMDRLTLAGGFFYRFMSNKTQTLTSPNGTLVCNSSPNNFTNIETYGGSIKSYFRKDWGSYICLDYVKVKDNDVQRNNALCIANNTTDLYFYTGQNSDNINNTAGGFWSFSLGQVTHTPSTQNIIACQAGAVAVVELSILGEDFGGYRVSQKWHDAMGTVLSTNSQTLFDDDNNPATPFVLPYSFVPLANGFHSFSVEVLRCGTPSTAVQCTSYVTIPTPNLLINANSQGDCFLANEPMYIDFYDDTQSKPIASVQDFTGAGDVVSLGVTTARVSLDPSITLCDGITLGARPRLPRHWQITPATNGNANVRLYFTQTELSQLAIHTSLGALMSPLDLELWKFPDGQLCNMVPTVVPFTLVNMAGSTAGYPNDKAFSSTADVIAIEFSVSSFSHFVLVPTQPILLASDLLHFNATLNANNHVALDWRVSNNENKSYFKVERSADGTVFQPIAHIDATNKTGETDYTYLDSNPLLGVSYYRIRQMGKDNQTALSLIKSVNVKGAEGLFVYPNPAKNLLNIRFSASTEGLWQLAITNALGQTLYTADHDVQMGDNTLQMPLNNLPSGSYHCRITNDSGFTVYRTFIVE